MILDPAPAQPLSRELLSCVDYITPNQSELQALTGRAVGTQAEHAARDLAAGSPLRVIVKMGDVGALLVERDRQSFWPSLRVEARDATGAGDAFNAALAVALAEGRPLAEAGRLGRRRRRPLRDPRRRATEHADPGRGRGDPGQVSLPWPRRQAGPETLTPARGGK